MAIALLFVHACEIVTVEPPDIDVNDYYTPEYVVKGRIINANDNGGVSGAEVFISGISLTTNDDGFYEHKSNSPVGEGTHVEVQASGFVKCNTTISYGDSPPLIYYLDLYLTPEEPFGNINLITGGEIDFGSVHVSVPGDNFAILDSDSLVNINLGITPLHTNSSVGNQSGGTVKTIFFRPVGMHFEKPAVFRVDVPSELVFTQLTMYEYSDTTDLWTEVNTEIFYDSIANQLEFSLRDLPIGVKITDPNMITIFNDGIYSEPAVVYEPNSCDCEGAYLWTGGYYIRHLTIAGTGVLNELNSMHFFSDNNMPYYPALYISGIFESPVVTNLSIPECMKVVVEISRWYREISGTYVYVNETKTYTVRYYFGVSVSTSIQDCPITSNCHQGCI